MYFSVSLNVLSRVSQLRDINSNDGTRTAARETFHLKDVNEDNFSLRDSIENLLKSRTNNNNNGRRGAKEGLVSCEFNCLMTQTSEEQFLDHFSITFWQDRCYKTFLQNQIFYPKILFLDLPKIDLRMSTLGDLPGLRLHRYKRDCSRKVISGSIRNC